MEFLYFSRSDLRFENESSAKTSTSFIRLLKTNEIDCTFYVGPYNATFCKHKDSTLIPTYEETISRIKKFLVKEEMEFIDGTDISYKTGTFIDVQHISQYGAYLTALQIKAHYEKHR